MKALLPLAALILSACTPAAPAIEISDAWARATAPGQGAAVYATIANPGEASDRFEQVATPRAAMAMLHSVDNAGGIARMQMVAGVDVPAGETVALAPGGTHIMLDGLKLPLAAGESFPVTLTFAKAGARTVTVKVVAAGAR